MPTECIETTGEEEFIEKSVHTLAEHIRSVTSIKDMCILGLSGGSTPKPIYEKLGKETLPWEKVALFLVDDRFVPADHDDSNRKLVRETLLVNAPIPESQIFFPKTELPIDECIEDYTQLLTALLQSDPPDIITLGLGPDGHIASLFPPVPEYAFSETVAIHTTTEEFAVRDRISISPLVIMAAQTQLLLIKGEEKKKVFEECIAADMDPERWPLQVALATGNTTVIIG